MNIKKILKNKKVILAFIIILLFVLATLFNNRQIKKSEEARFVRFKENFGSGNTESQRIEKIKKEIEGKGYYSVGYPDLVETSKKVYDLEKHLPISFLNYETSVGIKTGINIYNLSSDPKYLVRIEIMGLRYISKSTDPQENPEVKAFEESFNKALSELEARGIDPKDLYFKFGTRDYINETSVFWVEQLQLLNY